jgi:hypothetical protein
LYSTLFFCAQGAPKSDSAAISTATGSAKRSTGRTQAVSGRPLENHTTISESR